MFQPQGGNMNEFSPWTHGNWYALGNLLTQLAFLVAGVWFARNILRIMRAFQEQVGALLKLSINATPAERNSASAVAKGFSAEASPYWLTPSETQTVSLPEPAETGPGRFVAAWHRLSLWLQAPMSTSKVGPWRRVISWLQAPVSS
jgi:hypothetical protein